MPADTSPVLGLASPKTVPVTGCDGVPAHGQKHVSTGILTATIISPSTSD